jgi:E3 ubiquitin-protein ligase NEDD4
VDVVSSENAVHTELWLTKSRNNDITDALELTFSTEDERFGETVSIEMKPGGEEIEVTNENKREYVE